MFREFQKEVFIALQSVSKAAEFMENACKSRLYNRIKESKRDIVTDLDIAIESIISDHIKDTGYPIIGEETNKENKLLDFEKPTWVIDPIDGTTNFVSNIPIYSISIGLIRRMRFLLGAVVVPAMKEVFFTSDNGFAYMNGIKLQISPANLSQSLVAMAFSGEVESIEERKKEYMLFGNMNDQSRGCLRLGSASINICYVAASRLQAAVGLNNKIWDVAGALAVAIAAGARLYFEWVPNTTRVSYIVGAQGAADELAEMLNNDKVGKLNLWEN